MNSIFVKMLLIVLMLASVQGQYQANQRPRPNVIQEYSCSILNTNKNSVCNSGRNICRFSQVGIPTNGRESCKCQFGDTAWKYGSCRAFIKPCQGSRVDCAGLLGTNMFCVFQAGKPYFQVLNGMTQSPPTYTHVMAGQCPKYVNVFQSDNPGALTFPPPVAPSTPNPFPQPQPKPQPPQIGNPPFLRDDPGTLFSCSQIKINSCAENEPKVCSDNSGRATLYNNLCDLCRQIPSAFSYITMYPGLKCQ